MCSIYTSTSLAQLEHLRLVNSYRGSRTHSFGIYTPQSNELSFLVRSQDPIDFQKFKNWGFQGPDSANPEDSRYYVGHSQAPTSKDANIHPAEFEGTFLWHNGIVKEKETNGWDTMMICQAIRGQKWDALSNINGTFACLYFDGTGLYVFRNEISPLFYNDSGEFSSTKLDGFQTLPPNQVFKIMFVNQTSNFHLNTVGEFKTKENPYFFA